MLGKKKERLIIDKLEEANYRICILEKKIARLENLFEKELKDEENELESFINDFLSDN